MGRIPVQRWNRFKTGFPDVSMESRPNILCAYAQQHLEAWYFADAENLKSYLGRALGQVDTSKPDEIQNPKLHLKHLLGERVYNARISEEIASALDSGTIAGRSPSFKKFVDAIMNGGSE